MRRRWQGAVASILITLVAVGMVILDLTDVRFRRWWDARALTSDTVAGALVVLLTVLVVDQIVERRQEKDRARAVAAQAAIVRGQAIRSAKAVSAALAGKRASRDGAASPMMTNWPEILRVMFSPTGENCARTVSGKINTQKMRRR